MAVNGNRLELDLDYDKEGNECWINIADKLVFMGLAAPEPRKVSKVKIESGWRASFAWVRWVPQNPLILRMGFTNRLIFRQVSLAVSNYYICCCLSLKFPTFIF